MLKKPKKPNKPNKPKKPKKPKKPIQKNRPTLSLINGDIPL